MGNHPECGLCFGGCGMNIEQHLQRVLELVAAKNLSPEDGVSELMEYIQRAAEKAWDRGYEKALGKGAGL